MSRILLPLYERKSQFIKDLLSAQQLEIDRLSNNIADLEKQLNIDTATWALSIYEKDLGIESNLTKSLEERRSVIKSKWRGTGKVDRTLIKLVVDAFTNGGVDVSFDGRIIVTFNDIKGIPPNLEDAQVAVENICPAHLAVIYQFAYMLIKEIHEVMTLAEMEQIPLHKFAGGEV